jgi:hypothetical protein
MDLSYFLLGAFVNPIVALTLLTCADVWVPKLRSLNVQVPLAGTPPRNARVLSPIVPT